MRKRRLIWILAVVAMTMAVMAPASAHPVTKTGLEDRGWSCFDNSGDGGAGNHCSPVPIGDYIGGGTGDLFLYVFTGGEGDTLIGVEWLEFTRKDLTQKRCDHDSTWVSLGAVAENLYACHNWLPGLSPF
ncbi:MAG: hypothetical protein ACC654_05845 [Acidimicrobiia bacterium]